MASEKAKVLAKLLVLTGGCGIGLDSRAKLNLTHPRVKFGHFRAKPRGREWMSFLARCVRACAPRRAFAREGLACALACRVSRESRVTREARA